MERRPRQGKLALLVAVAMLTVQALPLAAGAAVPEAYDGYFLTKVDTPVGVWLDAFDGDFDSLTYAVTGGPANGSLDDCSSGSCTYTPNAGFTGTDSFTFVANDGTDDSNEATVTIDVNPNSPPVAYDDSFTTKVDTPVSVWLFATDPDFDSLTYSVTGGPSSGSVDDCSSGACTYTPDPGFLGTDSLTFVANDGTDDSNEATITIEVNPNSPPVASNGAYTTSMDTPESVWLSASDPDFDPLSFTVTGGPSSGSLSDCSFGSCTYTPDPGFLGTDSFAFTASDGEATSNEATVTIEVVPPCDPATCIDNGTVLLAVNPEGHLNTHDASSSAAGAGDAGLHYIPTGNEATSPGCLCEGWGAADAGSGVTGYANIDSDGGAQNLDLISFSATASTAMSVVEIDDTLRVTHDFHPSASTADLYEVTVTIDNLTAGTLSDVRYRRVMDWDIEPTPFSEFVTIDGGSAANLLFSSNDGFATANPLFGPSDIGETGSFTDSGPDDHGALFDFGFGALGAGESVTFNIYYGASGTEAGAISAVAAVDAEVFSFGQPNTTDGPTLGTPNTFIFAFAGVGGEPLFAPQAEDDTLTTPVDTPGDVDVLANDTDPNGDPLEVTAWTQGANGSVSCTSGGVCTYTPNPGFVGADSFTYTISDGTGGTDTATVTVTVEAADNAAPVVDAGEDASGSEGSAIGLSGSASDGDGDPLTLAWTYTAGAGVDAGATCSFSDETAVSTTITCTDDGEFTVTLSADDGINAPVEDSATVTVANADPGVSITVPTAGDDFAVGATVALAATLTDAGSNDTHTCQIDWGDGSVEAGTVAAGECTGSHTYAAAGPYTIAATVTDDDGGIGSDTVGITVTAPVNAAPVVEAGEDASGSEGSAIGLSGSASDGDGDPLTLAWTYTAGAGVDAGATCSFSDPTAASTTITCTDDGEFTVTLSADDGVNPAVEDSATVTVGNADPGVSITSPSDGATFSVGQAVNLAANLSDAGSNDTHTCQIDWGDGTVEAGTVAAGECTGSHTYATVAIPSVVVTATDDNGGTGTDEIMLVITSKAAKVTGGGFLFDEDGNRVSLGLVAAPGDGGGYDGQIQVRIHNEHRFHGTDVDWLTSAGKTATWGGSGRWNGEDGYTYEATVEDLGNGKSKKGSPDTFSITVWDAFGTVVYTTSGPLGGGNLKVH